MSALLITTIIETPTRCHRYFAHGMVIQPNFHQEVIKTLCESFQPHKTPMLCVHPRMVATHHNRLACHLQSGKQKGEPRHRFFPNQMPTNKINKAFLVKLVTQAHSASPDHDSRQTFLPIHKVIAHTLRADTHVD